MKSKKYTPTHFTQEGVDLAEGVWETQGPESGTFLKEKYDFEILPAKAIEELEEDLGRPYTAEERALIEKGYKERLGELLKGLIEGTKGILEKVKAATRKP